MIEDQISEASQQALPDSEDEDGKLEEDEKIDEEEKNKTE